MVKRFDPDRDGEQGFRAEPVGWGGGGTHRNLNKCVGSALLGAAFDTVAQVGESELLTDPVEFGFEDFAADNP